MNDNYISLLWPDNEQVYASKTIKLSDSTIESLDIAGFCKRLSDRFDEYDYIEYILTHLCHDEGVIKYRQNIFSDIISSKTLLSSLETILENLKGLKLIDNEASILQEVTFWTFFNQYKKLGSYTDIISTINETFKGLELKSEGLSKLKNIISSIAENEEFKKVSKSINELSVDIDEIKSLTLGINLDGDLNPIEATLVSVNKTNFKDNGFWKNYLDRQGMINIMDNMSKIHRLGNDPRHPLMYHLSKDIENLLKPVIKNLSKTLKKLPCINTNFLTSLIPEITFYLRAAKLYNYLTEHKMPVCMPQVLSLADRKNEIKNTYNVNLVIQLLKRGIDTSKEIVLNDVLFNDDGRIFILTGPNRGGKTVYTEAIAFAQILFQAGLFVPGTEGVMSPVDSIYTHFPVDENQTVTLGRLGEESKRLGEIFAEASSFSLILLNESLSSTSFTEGIYIANDVVKSLRYLGARALFNTHMHELAKETDIINNTITGNSKVVSLVTGMENGKRSYKIYKGEPLGKSYARDIAIKYGMSFEQITKSINIRKSNNTKLNLSANH